MMKEMKKSWKMLKYAYNVKINTALGVIFLVLGIIILGIPESAFFNLGVIYILLGTLMPVQMHYSLMHSNMVAASGKRHIMELTIPNRMTIICAVGEYILLVVVAAVICGIAPEKRGDYIGILVISALMISIVVIYFGACYKIFLLSSIFFAITYLIMYGLSVSETVKMFISEMFANSIILAAFAGFIILVAGLGISCLLRRILYKKKMSPWAGGASLRKAMQ